MAYLDNELKGDQRRALEKRLQHDEALSTRLSQLEQTQFDFGAAFSPMLDQAPVAEIQSRLDKLAYIPTAEATKVGLSRRSLLAAALSFLMIGAGVGRFVLSPTLTLLTRAGAIGLLNICRSTPPIRWPTSRTLPPCNSRS
ncbi:hypothetical protein O1V64_05320 [Rouxiella badensis]|nr:hypothetical protein O1V64_05320 [Rouxiella badensis]